jgi:plasmid stabilization system protein ParE
MARRLVQRRAAEEDVAEQLAYLAADRPAVAHRYAIALEDAYQRIRAQKFSCFAGRTTISATFTSIGCVTA